MGFDGQRETKFKIPVSDTQAYKQFGNAVVVPAAKAVAKLMLPHISAALAARPKARKNEQLPLLDSVEPTAIITAHG
jgi:DNA (cytosine-5)-methyltransferase 1